MTDIISKCVQLLEPEDKRRGFFVLTLYFTPVFASIFIGGGKFITKNRRILPIYIRGRKYFTKTGHKSNYRV